MTNAQHVTVFAEVAIALLAYGLGIGLYWMYMLTTQPKMPPWPADWEGEPMKDYMARFSRWLDAWSRWPVWSGVGIGVALAVAIAVTLMSGWIWPGVA